MDNEEFIEKWDFRNEFIMSKSQELTKELVDIVKLYAAVLVKKDKIYTAYMVTILTKAIDDFLEEIDYDKLSKISKNFYQCPEEYEKRIKKIKK